MRLKRLEISGFKSFARKSVFEFSTPISAIVGPNGSGKSNVAEAIRFVLGEQSIKSLRGKRGEDLIFNGSKDLGRQSRAKVSLVFDNTNRAFPSIDYDEVLIERVVHRDSSNEYFINGTQVRLRDVIELLASVHIGASGHHIISQGEADRILGASTKEKKAIIEDALGLRVYHWKIAESEKKLVKTRDNMAQVALLRKEIVPHIRFLKKQVEKVEQARNLREELRGCYREYLKRESVYLGYTQKRIHDEGDAPRRELREIERQIVEISSRDSVPPEIAGWEQERRVLQGELGIVRGKKDELLREIGRFEGVIEYEEEKARNKQKGDEDAFGGVISARNVEIFVADIEDRLAEADHTEDKSVIRAIFANIRTALSHIADLYRNDAHKHQTVAHFAGVLEEKKNAKEKIEQEITETEAREEEVLAHLDVLRKDMEKERDQARDSEKALLEKKARRSELASQVSMLDAEHERIEKEAQRFKEEIKEGIVLIGRDVTEYEHYDVSVGDCLHESRDNQEERRRKIEKIKIRLEDIGGGSGEDIVKEYDEAVERDAFLEKEITDMETSAQSLASLITDLTEKLGMEFKEGITKINAQFSEFFALMFGGGTASLTIVKEKKYKSKPTFGEEDTEMLESLGAEKTDEPAEEGIEVCVNLPRKKIKGLQMLSGGERALTSIALLFAISQVNPPPFLVLDETDAALDEANSRKYGDMLENLSRYSQLIVITHNRETMSRVDILYGVTMGADAASKMLSVRFEEAESYAK